MFPSSTLFHYPILLLLADGKEHTRSEMVALEIEKLSISSSDQKVLTPKGVNKVVSWTSYAIADLKKAEYIAHSGKGYTITASGLDFINSHKEGFVAKELKASAAYRIYKNIKDERKAKEASKPESIPEEKPEVLRKKDEGFVYILTNDAFKANYIKIGYTTDLDERLRSLYNTSVPKPFKVYALLKTRKYKFAEKLMHETFRDYRTGEDREFFLLIPEVALEQLKVVAEGLDAVVITYDDKGNEKKVFDYSK